MLVILLFSCSAFNPSFAAYVAPFLSKSALFINPAIADLPGNSFCFIFASSIWQ